MDARIPDALQLDQQSSCSGDLKPQSSSRSPAGGLYLASPMSAAASADNGTSKKAAVSSSIKGLLLAALVIQNATLNVTARWSRVVAEQENEATGCGFRSTTAVVTIEMIKVVASFFLFASETRSSDRGALGELWFITTSRPLDCVSIAVPALAYVVQNNLLLVAADNLEGPVLALFGQLKILTTALFSVTMLRRTLGARCWFALVALTLGIATVQVSQIKPTDPGGGDGGGGDAGSKNVPLGLALTMVVATISGFSGVYFEMVLKSSPISVWLRNVHLAGFSLVIALCAALRIDSEHMAHCGFWGGYSSVVWLYVGVQAFGGLLIAAVIKYADNILKAFATSVAIILVALIANLFFAFELSRLFFAGVACVLYAIFLYGDLLKDLPLYNRLPRCLGGNATLTVDVSKTELASAA